MKRLLFLLALCLGSLASWAYNFSAVAPTGQTLYYNITSTSTVSVTYPGFDFSHGWDNYAKPTDSLAIPSTVTDSVGATYSVTKIGDYVFFECSGLTSVTIPSSVEIIDLFAFAGCTSLTSVTIPSSVESIDDFAFYGCSGLTDLTISNSVTTLGTSAFEDCSSLTSVTIPSSVTTIGEHAFHYCSGLTSVTIPNSVTTIGNGAFEYCSGLSPFHIPCSVTSIGESAFSEIDTVLYRGSASGSPWGAGVVTAIDYTEEGDSLVYDSPDKDMVVGCNPLVTIVTIPSSVIMIGEGAFEGCTRLTSVTIPSSVTTIGANAFAACNSLASVTIPSSVTTIGNSAFEFCSRLTSVTIPSSVTTIGERAFEDCNNLTSATIPNSVTTIGASAFEYCSGLSPFHIPCSVTSIGESAFSEIDTVLYRGSASGSPWGAEIVTAIDYTEEGDPLVYDSPDKDMVVGCNPLVTLVTIPSSVIMIGDGAFEGCSRLTSVTIPSSVTTIGEDAFFGAEMVFYCGEATGSPWGAERAGCFLTEGDFVFEDDTKTTLVSYIGTGDSVSIPNTVSTIAEKAFKHCFSLSSVTIPSSLTTIENHAFENCVNVATLYFNAKNLISSSDWYNPSEACNSYGFRPMHLQTLVVGDSVESLPQGVFYGQSTIDTLYYNAKNLSAPETWYGYGDEYNSYGFRPMSLDTLIIGDGVGTLPCGVFYRQSGLTSVSIPNSVSSIGSFAFYGCTGLTSISIPNSVTKIRIGSFYGCTSLTSLSIPGSVTEIGASAFSGCSGLTSVSIGSAVTQIESQAFLGCTNVATLYYNAKRLNTTGSSSWVSPTDASIGFRPMRLQNLVIGDSVEVLPDYVFAYQENLSNVTIPNSVKTIKGNAFRNNSSLSTLTIPNSVTSIDGSAFMDCAGLTSVTLPNSITTINRYTFNGCTSLQSIVIPASVTSIGSSAFEGCTSLKTVYNLSNLTITKGNSGNGEVASNALRVLDSVRGFTNHGAGSNALHKIDNGTYTVVAAEDGDATHIPVATIPANFLYYQAGNAKAGGWRAKEVELTDDTSRFCAPVDFTADTASYTREFTDGHRSTLYLPFTAAIPDNFEVYEFSNYDNGTLYFAPNEDSIRAYTPYLVGYDLGKEVGTTQCTITAATATFPASVPGNYHPATHGDMTFQGTLVRTPGLSTNNYGYKDGFFVQSGGAAHVNPFRCYFTYTGGGAGQTPPPTIGVAFGDGLLGIDTPDNPAPSNGTIRYSNDVYDLMGRLVRKDAATLDGLPTGIYIWKGEKVLRMK